MIPLSTPIRVSIRSALPVGIAAIVAIVMHTAVGPTAVSAQSPQPVLLASGQFGGTDSFHKGEGKARVFRLADGALVLRLEEFKVTNGPDLYVYLSGHPPPAVAARFTKEAPSRWPGSRETSATRTMPSRPM